VREIFEENKSKMLQGTIVWTPMLMTDSPTAAKRCEAELTDFRVKHCWDPDRILGQLLSHTLNLKASMAWDVYLIYSANHSWDVDLPPAPKFWMHQLDEEPILLLDPRHLKRAVQAMIAGVTHE
jgi:hypothetical protein